MWRILFTMMLFASTALYSDTLVVKVSDADVVSVQPVHKDTVDYYFNAGVSSVFIENIKDSIDVYHPNVLNLWIYTYGGDPLVAIDFYYWLKSRGIKIRTFVGGVAASAGVIMFVWGDERYISPHGLLFVHQVSTWVFLEKYNPKSSENMAIALKTIQNTIEDFICKRTGISQQQLKQWMVEEKWFDAESAIKSGLATGIVK